MHRSDRLAAVRSSAWLFLGVTGLLYLVGLRYLAELTWPDSALARFYVVAAFVGHFALLALAPWLVVVLPLCLVGASKRVVLAVGCLLAALVIAFVQIDSLVFAADRFHLSGLALRVLGAPTWTFACIYFVIAIGLCALLARLTARHLSGPASGRRALLVGGVLLVALGAANGVHAWADARFYVPITAFTPYLPLYRPLTAKNLLARWIDLDLARQRDATAIEGLAAVQGGVLDYPKHPLQCTPPERPYNVLLVGLDAMRRDALNPRVTPELSAYAEQTLRFEKHWSGGNGTRPGLFSLFYGIPSTYWDEFYAAQRAPVLIETFQKSGYQVGVFPSNPPDRIVGLDRTAFRSVPSLPTTVGDLAVTENWLRFLAERDSARPFFAFLFFESAPGGCRPEFQQIVDADVYGTDDAGRRACYETALHFADHQAGRVLAALRESGLWDHTIVIVTSDHGEEFDDSGQGFRGHGSGYSRFQLNSPLAIHWPGRGTGTVNRRTSHNDIAPTLLTEVLGCTNPPSDYSSGHSLFSGEEWTSLVAASYTSLAIVEPDRITISQGPYYEVRDQDYRLLDPPVYDPEVLGRAIRETGRFLRR